MAKFFVKYQTKKQLKSSSSNRTTVPFDKAQRFGILFQAGSKEKFLKIKELYLSLKNEGKEVDVLSYLGKHQQNFEFLFKIFSDKDFTFFGKTENADVLEFIDRDFDYLLHLDTDSLPVQDYILAASKAKCRVGKYDSERNDLYEMMFRINETDGISALIDQINFYTHRITNV